MATLSNCRVLFWQTVYSSTAPAGDASVHVQETGCGADCVVQVVVKQGWRSVQVANRTDCVINFAHAAWSGAKVAVFVDNHYCGPFRVAYDTATGQPIDFALAESWLKADIIRSYAVTSEELRANGGDVFQWATYTGAETAPRSIVEFRKRTGR